MSHTATIVHSSHNGTAFPPPATRPLDMQAWLNRPRRGLLRWLDRHNSKGR